MVDILLGCSGNIIGYGLVPFGDTLTPAKRKMGENYSPIFMLRIDKLRFIF